MGVAKRLYLYAVSAVSLLVLAIGLFNLVAVGLGELADALGAGIIGGGASAGREQVSLAIALVVVGAPVFALHWWLVGRGWHAADDAGREDRHSAIRAFHLGLVATVALAVGTWAALESISWALQEVLDVALGRGRPTDAVALLLVAAPIWWYHQRRRNLDIRHDRLTRAAAWITRLHRYAWAFVGLMILVFGASGVIETIASVAIGRPGFGAGDDWWIGSLAGSVSMIVVGGVVFWLHAEDARRAIRDAAIIGEDDRASGLRATYFGAVMLVALVYVVVTVASSLAGLGRWVLGVAEGSGVPAFLELVVGPLLVAIPLAIAGWLHRSALQREAGGRSPAALAAAERLGRHLAAAVGLAFLAVGTAQVVGRLLEVAIGAARVDDFFRSELAWLLAQVIIGAGLWIPSWALIMRRRATNPLTERRATIGRAYLYLAVGAALIAAVPSAAFTLYRLIDTLLGGRGVALGAELSIPLGVVIVASVVALYHGRLLVSDLRFSGATAPPEVEPAAVTSAAIGATPEPVAPAMLLILRGPIGTESRVRRGPVA